MSLRDSVAIPHHLPGIIDRSGVTEATSQSSKIDWSDSVPKGRVSFAGLTRNFWLLDAPYNLPMIINIIGAAIGTIRVQVGGKSAIPKSSVCWVACAGAKGDA